MARTIEWEGRSGAKYQYFIHEIDTSFKDVPGNYIFAKEGPPRSWTPLYIGETESLRDRPLGPGHEKWPCAVDHEVTHIHAHESSPARSVRQVEEQDLIRKWNPPCNDED